MLEPIRAPREGGSGGAWIYAKVAAVGQDGARLTLPSGDTTQKYCPCLVTVAVGDPVMCLRFSGTIIVFGKIGGTGGGGGGSALPAGGNIYDALVKQSSASGDAVWSPLLYRGSDGGLCEVDAI